MNNNEVSQAIIDLYIKIKKSDDEKLEKIKKIESLTSSIKSLNLEKKKLQSEIKKVSVEKEMYNLMVQDKPELEKSIMYYAQEKLKQSN